MQGRTQFSPVRNCLILFIVSAATSGCLTEKKQQNISSAEEGPAEEVTVEKQLTGSVGYGPVVGANMQALQNDGVQIAQFLSDSNASYLTTVSTESQFFPLTIESNGGTDLVTNREPEFAMLGAAISSADQVVSNVNPFSTFTVRLAEELPGGLTSSNIDSAQATVSAALNSGLGPLAASGPMTTQIDEHNVAEIVKASETLAELVRRTRWWLTNSGYQSTGDSVVVALASDLIDGVIDGRGGADADARTAAFTTLVYVMVLIESMTNELQSNGSNITDSMNQAINQVVGQSPTTTLAELPVTAEMLDRSRVGLAAAFAFDSRDEVSDLRLAVGGLQAGMSASQVAALVPSNYRDILKVTLRAFASADMASIDMINDIARGDDVTETANRPPEIQGDPTTSIETGAEYLFVPSASDPDGGSLTFSIVNPPSWASFDTQSGRLAGTPSGNDLGTYPDIVISVSDGEFSDSLAAFEIEVFDGNIAPTISGTPATTVAAGDGYVFAPTASDPNGDPLTFTINNRPYWANFNSSTGRLSGEASESDVGTYNNIVISVTDGILTDSLASFRITVNSSIPEPNTPPTILGDPTSELNANSSYSFTPEADDADGDSLTFTISNRPSWANFDASSGRLSGTPDDGDVGVYSNIRITVSDGTDTASMEFTITVNAVSLGSVTLIWTPPTQNENGSALLDLAGYRIYWGKSGSYPNSVTIDNPGLTTYQVENLASGTYEFVATSYNSNGVESDHSNPITKIVN